MTAAHELKTTYTEIYVVESPETTCTTFDQFHLSKTPLHVSEQYFRQALHNMCKSSRFRKFFSKTFKTYVSGTTVMEDKESEVDVYQKKPLMYCIDTSSNTVHIGYNKVKLSYHMFPCTTKINSIFITRRLSFLINSHLYINFDICQSVDDTQDVQFKIFINLNSDKNIDIDNSKNLIKKTLDCVQKRIQNKSKTISNATEILF